MTKSDYSTRESLLTVSAHSLRPGRDYLSDYWTPQFTLQTEMDIRTTSSDTLGKCARIC